MVMADADVSVSAAGIVDVSSTDGNSGGCVDLEAGGNLRLAAGSIVDADAGATAGSGGGLVCLVAGSPDLPGDLTVGGTVHAKGSTTGVGSARATLESCTIHVTSTGIVDTTGDTQARNNLIARRALVIDAGAQIKTTGVNPSSRSNVTLPTGAPLPAATAFTPPLLTSDVTLLPPCTALAQTGCLIPCPTCGNGTVEFPESCDTGGQPDACCDATCRAPFCDDFDPCTVDACSIPDGCTHARIPGCTTTTTTIPPPTTTTLPGTTTTSTTVTTTTVVSTTTSTVETTSSTTTTVTSTTSTTQPTETTTTTTVTSTTSTIATTSTTTTVTSSTEPTVTTSTTVTSTTETTVATTSSPLPSCSG